MCRKLQVLQKLHDIENNEIAETLAFWRKFQYQSLEKKLLKSLESTALGFKILSILTDNYIPFTLIII